MAMKAYPSENFETPKKGMTDKALSESMLTLLYAVVLVSDKGTNATPKLTLREGEDALNAP